MDFDNDVDVPAASVEPASTGMPLGAREWLRGIPWLSQVPRGTLDTLAARAVIHHVPAGVMIFDQAETPVFATFLICGRVELLGVRDGDEMLLELVSPPDMLLPAAVLTSQPYLLRARVLDDAHLLMVQADVFREAVLAEPVLCQALLALQAAHFRRQLKQSKNVRLRSAEERIGAYLLRLAESASGSPIKLPMGKGLIASQLGMTRETFSRALALLPAHGLRVEGDLLTVEDAATAHSYFRLDPLIDSAETILPLANGRT